jgi:HK97 family phage major capsid protein
MPDNTLTEIEKAAEAVAEKSREAVEKRLETVATKEEVNGLIEKQTALEATLKEQGTSLAEINVRIENKNERKSFRQDLRDQLKAVEKDLAALKETRGGSNISIKAAHTLHVSDVVPAVAGAAPYILTDLEAGITRVPHMQPFLRQICETRTTTKMFIAWAEQTNIQGNAGMVAEGALKPQNSFDIMEKTTKVEKVAKFIKTSKENLDDISEMASLINDELRYMCELKLDQQIFAGSGTSPELKGITLVAPAFDVTGTPFVASVVDPNYADVIMIAAGLVAFKFFIPNYVLVNPLDAVFIQMSKTTQGAYVIPPFSTADGMNIAGLRVVTSNLVPIGEFVVGDFTKAHLRIREEFLIDIGYEMDDFTKNLVTMIGEMRAGFFIKANEVNAFVQGNFATAITAIAKPVVGP